MKKIFLFTLLTCFMCVNGWATNVAKISVEGQDDDYAANLTELNTKIAALSSPATVTLLKSINITNTNENVTLTIPAGKDVVLNLAGFGIIQDWKVKENGFKVEGYTPIALALQYDGPGDIDQNSLIYNQGTLRIVSEGNSIVQMNVKGFTGDGGTATTICNSGNLTIDGGVFIGPWGATGTGLSIKLPVIWSKGSSSNITINGGVFLCSEERSDWAVGPIMGPISGEGTWNIKGGIFSTSDEVYRVAEHPELSISTDHKSTKDSWLTGAKAPFTGYTAIDVPYTNANIVGYHDRDVTIERDPQNASIKRGYLAPKKVCVIVPTDREIVSSNKSLNGTVTCLEVQAGKTLTINENETLKVGSAGVILGGTDSKIVIKPGAALISDGDVITSAYDNIALTVDNRAKAYSALAIKAGRIQASHPNATVTLNAVSNFKDGQYKWQRFAIPTYQTDLTKASFVNSEASFGTAVYGWDYTNDDWKVIQGATKLEPFQCYNMTVNDDVQPNYVFKCELVGNGNPTIALHNKWNYLANSYTAPMSMQAVLRKLYSSLKLAAGVWVQDAPGSTNWTSVAYADVVFGELPIYKIEPMQAFVFYNNNAENLEISYNDFVYNPLITPTLYAPARHRSVAEDITRAHVIIEDADGVQETVKLYLSGDFSEAEDPGFDLPKYINADKFNFYAVTDLGNLERVASNNLDEIALILETKDATSFTLKFESVSLEGYAIRDNLTEEVISIAAESEYAFTAEDNATIADRFVVIKQQATAIDNIVPAGAKNGYYSMTGVYMGEDFHALPAGMYIINGKKVVK